MSKKSKILTLFIGLILMVSIVGVGIYAATTINPQFSTNVSFTPTKGKLQVLGFIDGVSQTEDDSQKANIAYFASNYNKTELEGNYTSNSDYNTFNNWSFGDLTLNAGDFSGRVTRDDFSQSENNGIVNPSNLVIYFQITNYIGLDMEYSFSYEGNLAQNNLGITTEYYIAANDNQNVVNGTNGFYALSENWGINNLPNSAPQSAQSTTAFSNYSTAFLSSGTAASTLVIKVTISPTQNFEPDKDLAYFNVRFNIGANLAS